MKIKKVNKNSSIETMIETLRTKDENFDIQVPKSGRVDFYSEKLYHVLNLVHVDYNGKMKLGDVYYCRNKSELAKWINETVLAA